MGPQWLEVRKKIDRPFRRNGIQAPKGRGSGVRVMTYVDDVLQSDPFAPGLSATVSLFDIYFWVKKFI